MKLEVSENHKNNEEEKIQKKLRELKLLLEH